MQQKISDAARAGLNPKERKKAVKTASKAENSFAAQFETGIHVSGIAVCGDHSAGRKHAFGYAGSYNRKNPRRSRDGRNERPGTGRRRIAETQGMAD